MSVTLHTPLPQSKEKPEIVADYWMGSRILGYVFIPSTVWLLFGRGGLWTNVLVWAMALPGFASILLWGTSPTRFSIQKGRLQVQRPWRGTLTLTLADEQFVLAQRTIINYCTETRTLQSSSGEKFLLWTRYLRGYAALREAVGVEES